MELIPLIMNIPLWFYLSSLFLAFAIPDIMSVTRLSLASFKLIKLSRPISIISSAASSRFFSHSHTPKQLASEKQSYTMPAVKLSEWSGAEPFLNAMEVRRTIYALNKKVPVPDARIQEIIKEALLHVPSSFNSQSTRILYLVGEEHNKLWDIVYEVLQGVVPADKFEPTAQKLAGFKAGYGTVSPSHHPFGSSTLPPPCLFTSVIEYSKLTFPTDPLL
jgi:hypothetical protein